MTIKSAATTFAAITLVSVLSLSGADRALAAGTPLLPNITPYPAWDLSIEVLSNGNRNLRFSTLSWNNGDGPLEIRGSTKNRQVGKQKVNQRIYNSDGTFSDVEAGWFQYHKAHRHIHFDDYAVYTLRPLGSPTTETRRGVKTTFCIIDTNFVETFPGSPSRAFYTSCGTGVQGMSVGWGDEYGSHLAGQSLDITNVADGDYELKIEIDPNNDLVELDDTDNVSSLPIRLSGGVVTPLR